MTLGNTVSASPAQSDDGFVASLRTMGLQELREVWQREVGPPPSVRSPELLRHLLGWRFQAGEHGGLSPEMKRALRKTGRPEKGAPLMSEGVRLSREWQGRRYDVERSADGFVYAGRTYKSLSQVAREITGTRWNGPRFFGLRDPT